MTNYVDGIRDFYQDKRVLITGHTGFKGSWLSLILKRFGAEVHGLALDPLVADGLYCNLGADIFATDFRCDIRDLQSLKDQFDRVEPHFVFHFAAQPLVRASYSEPQSTWSTNVMGTVNMMEVMRSFSAGAVIGVFITSDKCYENMEWVYGYREDDRLGGRDPYSGSKGAAELAISSYSRSFFSDPNGHKIVSVRAGNVIGGGDFSPDRIVPDIVSAWKNDSAVELRSPQSTRPWQHVLDPLFGYLLTGKKLSEGSLGSGDSFNFGPSGSAERTVHDLVDLFSKRLPGLKWSISCGGREREAMHEFGLLRLNCDKALSRLEWRPRLGFEETVNWTADWYLEHSRDVRRSTQVAESQILEFCDKL